MDIRLPMPAANLQIHIINAARAGGCFANIKHGTRYQCTFKLEVDRKQAPFEVQDKVIETLLQRHPDATIRTARAVYEGYSDFKTQKAARVNSTRTQEV